MNKRAFWFGYVSCVAAMVIGLALLMSLRHGVAGFVLGAIGLVGMGLLAWWQISS